MGSGYRVASLALVAGFGVVKARVFYWLLFFLPLWGWSQMVRRALPPGMSVLDPAQAEFEEGLSYFQQGKYAQAIRSLGSALSSLEESKQEAALFYIAESYRLLSRYPEAQAIYRALLARFPQGALAADARYREAETYYLQGKWVEAEKRFLDLSRTAPPSLQGVARIYEALCRIHLGQETEGLRDLQALVEGPDSGTAIGAAQALAGYFEERHRYDQAYRYWSWVEEHATRSETKSEAVARAGWALLNQGQWSLARQHFEQVRRSYPKSPWIRLANAGLLQAVFGEKAFDKYVALFAELQSETLESLKPVLWFDLGHSYLELQKYREAIRVFEETLRRWPRHALAELVSYEATYCRIELDPSQTLEEVHRFLEHYPEGAMAPRAKYLEASFLSKEGRWGEAIPIWEQLAQNPDGIPVAHVQLGLGRAAFELHRWRAAAQAYEKVAQADPHGSYYAQARLAQGMALRRAREPDKAVRALEEAKKALAGGPLEEYVLAELGLAYADAKHAAEAVPLLQELLTRYPESRFRPFAAYSLGVALTELKKYDSASRMLEMARELNPQAFYLPATYRLAWIAYEKQDVIQASQYVEQYDQKVGEDPNAARIPAGLYYWLGVRWLEKKDPARAEAFLRKVIEHPQPGSYLASGYFELAEAEREQKKWAEALKHYQEFQAREPKSKEASTVLLGIAEAELGLGQYGPSYSLIEQVMRRELEGKYNAKARMLLGEWYLAQNKYLDAAKAFSALSLLYDDAELTPRAMAKAAECFTRAGDWRQAELWRKKLKEKYPGFPGST
ncbi:tetratricopeptide repeat protein [Candidatus Methylacidithermus pantelleriae]|uniref:tetratricopeptide repeat protein n=1 Tax=Candidatus Methylacidithermus pantelleriae TaxID=2744239 RepID=UPI00157C7770|nr:tetratricopeptide repeat protein [Candidatus Methylacidithermus pantelleriae]